MKNNVNILHRILFSILLIFSSSFNSYKSYELEDFINKYYILPSDIIDIQLDKFISGNINNNSKLYYRLPISNETEEIFFDFQSEYGCLYVNIEEQISINSTSYDFIFCSEGVNNLFNLSKSIIQETINNKRNKINEPNIIIGVGRSNKEKCNFDYSLKVSLRKPDINLFEINTEHKILCNTEKANNNNYRCNFVFTYNYNNDENDKDLIVYSISQGNINKLNIFADYINKEKYDKWDIEYLSNNIPNQNSNFINYNSEFDFIIIPKIEKDKYIYISVESNIETTIEMYVQTLNNEYKFPEMNNLKIYSFNKNSDNLSFDFNNLMIDEIELSLVTLYGKASVGLSYDKSTEYISDIRENKLFLNIDVEKCRNENECKLVIKKLEEEDEKEIGYIFYLYYSIKSNNKLNELIYGKSNKLLYNNFNYPIILYERIPSIDKDININLQLYNILNVDSINIFEIEILILSKEDIYKIKLNYNEIEKYENKIRSKFDSILAASYIYLTANEIKSFNIHKEAYLLIYISNNNININKIIIGSTISQVNSLIYPSERIYHFGKLNTEDKIVYRLKGKKQYHYMRLEFSCNSNYVRWSIRRENDNNNYMKNDTDLSFINEKWYNGKGILTIYIERGEDIFLTVFNNKNLANHVFKYSNSMQNDDIENYIIQKDSLEYNSESKRISINKLNDIPSSFTVNYYLKIIKEGDFIENEEINTIAITESNSNMVMKGSPKDNTILFDLSNIIINNINYYANAYSIIIENTLNIEYLSYSNINIKFTKTNSKKIVIITSICIGGFILLLILFFLIRICVISKKRAKLIEQVNAITFNEENKELTDDGEDPLI